MRAYSDPFLTREVFLDEVQAHRAADHYVSGYYWQNGRGCAVGCALETVNRRLGRSYHHDDHVALAKALCIPTGLVRLQDAIFEGLPATDRLDWPLRFASAIHTGADLSGVWSKFAAWIVRELALPAAQGDAQERATIERVAAGVETGWQHDDRAAAKAAASDAARAAASAAANDVTRTEDSHVVRTAAWGAVWAACADASDIEKLSVWLVRWATRAAAGAEVRASVYQRVADKLVAIMSDQPLPSDRDQ